MYVQDGRLFVRKLFPWSRLLLPQALFPQRARAERQVHQYMCLVCAFPSHVCFSPMLLPHSEHLPWKITYRQFTKVAPTLPGALAASEASPSNNHIPTTLSISLFSPLRYCGISVSTSVCTYISHRKI